MDFHTFARRAGEMLREVPPQFLTDVIGVEAHRDRKHHAHLRRSLLLGECAPDLVAGMTDPGVVRSRIHLYYGSFQEIARSDPEFDFEVELRETILHELRHHLEDRAGIPDLARQEEMEDARDFATEQAMEKALARWQEGEEMPDDWYRAGEEMEEDVWRVADDLFVELRLREEEFREMLGRTEEITVLDEPFDAEIPEDLDPDEILSFPDEGLERPDGTFGELHLIFMLR